MKKNVDHKFKFKTLNRLKIKTIIAVTIFVVLINTCFATAISGVTYNEKNDVEKNSAEFNQLKETIEPNNIVKMDKAISKNSGEKEFNKIKIDENPNDKTTLNYQYSFSTINTKELEYGTILSMEESDSSTCIPGEPMISMKTVEILIPSNSKVEDIEVKQGHELMFPGTYDIACGQQVFPLSHNGNVEITEKNPEIYNSLDRYPGEFYEVVSLQNIHGFKVLILNLFPMQYVPKNGEIIYYPKMELKVTTTPDVIKSDNVLINRLKTNDIEHIQSMVDNPELMTTYIYDMEKPQMFDGSDERPIGPDDTFDYVIITNEELRDANGEYTFQDLIQSKIDKGLTATIVIVEDIVACPDYWWDGIFGDGDPLYNDTQCHIRNFIRDAYQNWDTEYVLLGGDGDGADVGGESGDNIIPARLLQDVYDNTPIFDPVPSDLYYGCLDGSYDSNGNGTFGEPGDGFDIDPITGEVDLFAEVYVGRVPADSVEDVSNFVRKTLSYEASDGEELRDVWMVGEYLGFLPPADFGGNFKDEIKYGSNNHGYTTAGIPDLYNVSTLYDRDLLEPGWPKEELLGHINEGVHFINHLGHGNLYHVMKLDEPVVLRSGGIQGECHDVVENMTNDQYFFMYSQACYPGAFDNKLPIIHGYSGEYMPYDTIVEYMLTDEHGAFAAVANTRFGLGMMGSTNGPSQDYDREFFDALFGEDMRNLGKANQDSREDNIGKLGNLGLRYCYFEITLFGDPELSIKDPPQREHDLSVSEINAPRFLNVGNNTYINATINNQGLCDETDVIVNLLIDDVLINHSIISFIQSEEQVEVSFNWSNDIIGIYEICIEVESVPGENYLDNNVKTKSITVVESEPVKAVVLDGFIADFWPMKYQILNENWFQYGFVPVDIDYYSLNHDGITYDEIAATDADIIIIDSSFPHPLFQWEFTLDEIAAITQYVEEGHRLIAFFDTFGGNNDLLLPLVGLSSEFQCHDDIGSSSELNIFFDEFPLFTNIPDPCNLDMVTAFPDDGYWDGNEADTGIYLARTSNQKGTIALNTNNMAIYSSMLFDKIYDFFNNQLVYNSIVYDNYDLTTFRATASGPYSYYNGTSNEFSGFAIAGTPPYSWYWDFGDENYSTDRYPIHIYNQSGEYIVNLTVTDSIGNIANDTTTAIITTLEPIDIKLNPKSGVIGQVIHFSAQVDGGVPPYSWYWDFGDENYSTDRYPIHIYNQSGEYIVNLTVTDSIGNIANDTTTATITDPEPLIADAQGPYFAVVGEPLQLNGDANGGVPPYSYFWDFGDENYSTDRYPIHIYNQSGEYIVNLAISDYAGNAENDSTTVTITEPEPLFVNAQGPYFGGVGQLIQFHGDVDGGIPPYTWMWNFSDGNQSTERNPVHTYNQIGEYAVTLTVTDYVGNIDVNDTIAVIIDLQNFVEVDDDYNASTPGWHIDHFNSIGNGISVVEENGTVFVHNGTYYEPITIDKSLNLIGEEKNATIIDGYGSEVLINISYTDNTTIRRFTIQNSYLVGIGIVYSENITISDNIITDHNNGIFIAESSNCTIDNNIMINNEMGIVLIINSYNNKIIRNTIKDNMLVGIGIYMFFSFTCDNNLLFHNNFINNTQHAFDCCSNTWDNSLLQEGNYWDDFESNPGYPDVYEIPGGNNIDHYPLDEPWLSGDINGDGAVNVDDLLILLDAWGTNPGHPADLNGDGVVNVEDLLIVLANWS